MKKLFGIVLVLALVLSFSLVATTPVAAQTTYYVATTGNDGHTPAQAQNPLTPWATIQHAIDNVAAGDTIIVAAGTYAGNINVNKSNLTILGSVPASGRGAGPDAPIIDGASGAGSGFVIQANGITIEGFVIRDFGTGPENANRGHGVFAYNPGWDNITIRNNTIDNTNWCGIFAFTDDGSVHTNWDVSRNVVSNVDFYSIEYTHVHNSVIVDNYVDATGGAIGILVQAWGPDSSYPTSPGTLSDIEIRDNEVFGTTSWSANILILQRGHELKNVTVEGNTIRDSVGWGILVWDLVGAHENITVNRNAILDNAVGLGVFSTVQVDATLNWWGDASGPYHTTSNAGGTGDQVSDSVNFMPWLMEEDGAETTETNTDSGTGASASTTNVAATATGGNAGTTVTVGEYVGNPTGASPGFRSGAVYIDVHVGGPAPLPTQLMVEVACPSGVCSGVVLQWWDGDGWESVDAPTSVVNGKIQFVLSATSSPTIAQLTGTILGLGGLSTVGWEGSSVDKAAVMVPWIALMAAMMAGATLLVVRRRRAQI